MTSSSTDCNTTITSPTMHRAITLLLAVLAVFALAAPTPKAPQVTKRFGSFKVATNGRRHRHHGHGNSASLNVTRNPRAEIERAYRKFNWAITFVTPGGESYTLGLPDSSSSGSLFGGFGSSGSSSGSDAPSAQPSASTQPTVSAQPSSSAVQTGSAAAQTSATYSNSSGPSSTSSAVDGSVSGEVSANPEENESEYLSPVSIGGQTLNLDFDTGSADL